MISVYFAVKRMTFQAMVINFSFLKQNKMQTKRSFRRNHKMNTPMKIRIFLRKFFSPYLTLADCQHFEGDGNENWRKKMDAI